MAGLLEGKRGVVTGAAQGIGAAIAKETIAAGAEVVLCDMDSSVQKTAESLGGSSAIVDVTSPESVAKAFDEIGAQGAIDFLVNNAGIRLIKPLLQVTLADWQKVIAVDLDGPFVCTSAILPRMIEAGGGAIVNIASVAGILSFRDRAAYNAAKAGVMGLTRSVAAEHAADGIRCNAVAPGVIETPMTTEYFTNEDHASRIRTGTPLGRWGQPHEIAGPVVFLISDLASYVSGHTLVADGGWCAAKGY